MAGALVGEPQTRHGSMAHGRRERARKNFGKANSPVQGDGYIAQSMHVDQPRTLPRGSARPSCELRGLR
jgi:hypothetical protein